MGHDLWVSPQVVKLRRSATDGDGLLVAGRREARNSGAEKWLRAALFGAVRRLAAARLGASFGLGGGAFLGFLEAIDVAVDADDLGAV